MVDRVLDASWSHCTSFVPTSLSGTAISFSHRQVRGSTLESSLLVTSHPGKQHVFGFRTGWTGSAGRSSPAAPSLLPRGSCEPLELAPGASRFATIFIFLMTSSSVLRSSPAAMASPLTSSSHLPSLSLPWHGHCPL